MDAVSVIPDFHPHSRACLQKGELLKIVHLQDNNSTTIRFDGDGVRLRIQRFDCSSHNREAVMDLRVLLGFDGGRRVRRRSMKGAEQSYKHQTNEWQCDLHLDPFISART